ncbi:hypothetical protein [Sphingobacterium detergens]|nr:hypothetical protein [Sphingobacterium detergens]
MARSGAGKQRRDCGNAVERPENATRIETETSWEKGLRLSSG